MFPSLSERKALRSLFIKVFNICSFRDPKNLEEGGWHKFIIPETTLLNEQPAANHSKGKPDKKALKNYKEKGPKLLLRCKKVDCLNRIVQMLNDNTYISPCFNLNDDIRNAGSIAIITNEIAFCFILQQILNAHKCSEIDVYVNILDKCQKKDKMKYFNSKWEGTVVNIIGPDKKKGMLSKYKEKSYDLVIDTGIRSLNPYSGNVSASDYLLTLTSSLESRGTLYLYNLGIWKDARYSPDEPIQNFNPSNYDCYKYGYMYDVNLDSRPTYVAIRKMYGLKRVDELIDAWYRRCAAKNFPNSLIRLIIQYIWNICEVKGICM